MLYFSYGSNMSVKRFKDRVPSAETKCIATLKGHELRFHKKSKDGSGKCDAYETSNPAHAVIGVVFKILETEKPQLDTKEGLGHGYDQKLVILTTEAGEAIKAVTYYATKVDSNLKPYQWYLHHVLIGAEENGLPEDYVQNIRSISSIADPKTERHDREMAIYANK